MDLALNNLQRLICDKTQTNKHNDIITCAYLKHYVVDWVFGFHQDE